MKFWLSRYDPPHIPIFRQALKQRQDCARSDVFGEGVVSRAQDFAALADACAIISNICDIGLSSLEHERIAGEIARKLFPPMAKPLQFFNGRANGQYKVLCELGIWHASKFVQKHTGCWAVLGEPVDTEQKAEAICEQHHQQTFKDQLA